MQASWGQLWAWNFVITRSVLRREQKEMKKNIESGEKFEIKYLLWKLFFHNFCFAQNILKRILTFFYHIVRCLMTPLSIFATLADARCYVAALLYFILILLLLPCFLASFLATLLWARGARLLGFLASWFS